MLAPDWGLPQVAEETQEAAEHDADRGADDGGRSGIDGPGDGGASCGSDDAETPPMTISQPRMVMMTGQLAVQTIMRQHDREPGRQRQQAGEEDQRGCAANSSAMARRRRR